MTPRVSRWLPLLGCLGLWLPAAEAQSSWRAAQAQERWPEMLALAEAEGPSALRAQLDARYLGGDMVGALAAAERALQGAPQEPLYPAYLATRLAIDLDLPERAQEHWALLQELLAGNPPEPEPVRAWYREMLPTMQAEIDARQGVQEQAQQALVRARTTVAAAGLALLALLLLLRRR